MHLVFHNCMPYTDGAGGCDIFLNWHRVGTKMPKPNKGTVDMYRIDPINATNNNGLEQMVEKLQLIYKSLTSHS